MNAISFIKHCAIFVFYSAPIIITNVFNNNQSSKIVSHVASYTACIHFGYITSNMIYYIYLLNGINFIYLQLLYYYKPNIMVVLSGMFALLYAVIYNYCLADITNISNELFATVILTTSYITVIQGIYTTLCAVFFVKHHASNFMNIINNERAISFIETFKEDFELVDSPIHLSLVSFIKHWNNKTDCEIIDTIDIKTHKIFSVLKDNLDADKDSIITRDEFIVLAHKQNIFDDVNIGKLWNIFTYNTGRPITRDVIEYMLYHLLFQKKQFSHAIKSDIIFARWMTTYIYLFTFPLLCIILSAIWGYEKAFTGNISLFQIYIIIAPFAINSVLANIRFILYMAIVRPFNLGELLFIDDDIYKITHLGQTYVSCLGKDMIVVRNSQMLDNVVKNYSRSNINDSVQLEVPLNTRDDLVGTVYEKMMDYANLNWKYIRPESIRCGWVSLRNQSRVLQCNWQYSFIIYDRSKFNKIKTHFVNETIRCTINIVSRSFIMSNAFQGNPLSNPLLLEHFNEFSTNV
jgi:hypothetical protein